MVSLTHHVNVANAFDSFIEEKDFPCVGAKAALAHNQISYCVAKDISTPVSDAHILKKLQAFALDCVDTTLFRSFIVIFENSPALTEMQFEHYLWQRLQALHDKDAQQYGWDKQVSSDPESSDFSMSIGGKGFYVIGLHPGASRKARQFTRPAMVFNLHSQFELLREEGKYARLRETILKRDLKTNGSINPMLAVHGESSEARQYSGRMLEKEWKCPFHAQPKVITDDA